MASLPLLIAVVLASVGYIVYQYFSKARLHWADIPSLPRHFLFGNLLLLRKYVIPGAHIDYGLERIYLALGEPEWFYLDLFPLPFAHSFIVVTSPSIAEQLTRSSEQFPYSTAKSKSSSDLGIIAGKSTIFLKNGEDWKSIRKQFAPGFQPRYLQTRLPQIIEQAKIFLKNLSDKCATGEEFELGLFAKALTADVIGCMTFNQSLQAQTHNIDRAANSRPWVIAAFEGVQRNIPRRTDMTLDAMNPVRLMNQMYYQRTLDSQIRAMVLQSYQESKRGADSSRSIISLALTNTSLAPSQLDTIVDQVRSFLFAGYDTTSSLIQWLLYYLSLPSNASVLRDLIAEHDQVLGTSPEATEASLLTNPSLPFTTAVIKETLRLQPPAATARWARPTTDPPFHVVLADGRLSKPLNGAVLYINHRIIQRSPRAWGPDAHEFRPYRWLDKEYMSRIPAGAFRAFERGPRDCMGQELAMLEAKVVLAMTMRRFRFEKMGGRKGELGEVWNVYQLTSSPSDGMRMKVAFREKQ
ncbi:hypothetical protein PRK78_001589 [Emydomyces testavorans]|uniref:Cytochrome P450 n=1 Tax=Emydomyces testavorans TaxID=2070801 RepID=A0AAF0DCT7_9EURO|nr:hypothetical protein PRK78_001589 [Emydomyces testavorans]